MNFDWRGLLLVALVSVTAVAVHAYPLENLRFRADGTFKVAFFTDLHLGEDDGDDDYTVESITRLLDMERPDFIVFGGDIFSDYAGPTNVPKSKAWVRTQWNKLVFPLVYNQYQWAAVLGNHDLADMTQDEIRLLDASFPGSWTGMDTDVISIFGNATSNLANNVATRLYLFNSGVSGVGKQQMERYLNLSDEQKMQNIPSMAFVHIPPIETLTSYNYNDDLRGGMRDGGGVSCQRRTDADLKFNFLDVLRSRNEIKVLTFGHDHGNTFLTNYGGITLAYGQKTGHSGYGHWKSGCRVYFMRRYAPILEKDLVSLLPHSPLVADDVHGAQILDTRPTFGSDDNKAMPMTIRTWIRFDDGSYDNQRATRGGPAKHPLKACGLGLDKSKDGVSIIAVSALVVLALISVVVIHIAIVRRINEENAHIHAE
jgi:predicted MPP superfamily phosphohydrolase